jgi:hypothetical protein
MLLKAFTVHPHLDPYMLYLCAELSVPYAVPSIRRVYHVKHLIPATAD